MADEQNPILNNPYAESKRHYAPRINGKLDYQDVQKGRRIFVLVNQSAIPSRASAKDIFDVNDEAIKYEANLINRVRSLVRKWRQDDYPHVTTDYTIDLCSMRGNPVRIYSLLKDCGLKIPLTL